MASSLRARREGGPRLRSDLNQQPGAATRRNDSQVRIQP